MPWVARDSQEKQIGDEGCGSRWEGAWETCLLHNMETLGLSVSMCPTHGLKESFRAHPDAGSRGAACCFHDSCASDPKPSCAVGWFPYATGSFSNISDRVQCMKSLGSQHTYVHMPRWGSWCQSGGCC